MDRALFLVATHDFVFKVQMLLLGAMEFRGQDFYVDFTSKV